MDELQQKSRKYFQIWTYVKIHVRTLRGSNGKGKISPAAVPNSMGDGFEIYRLTRKIYLLIFEIAIS